MKRKSLMFVGAIGAVLLGLPYVFGGFGPTETEVGLWGRLSIGIGVVLGLLCLGIGPRTQGALRVVLVLGYLSLALAQVLPSMLWFEFHGFGISDGTPPSAFVAHWGYSLPHIVLFGVSFVVVVGLLKKAEGGALVGG